MDQQDLTPVVVVLDNQKDPVIGGFGLGLRSRLWGYFVKLDYAWPVENLQIDRRRIFLSLGYDF